MLSCTVTKSSMSEATVSIKKWPGMSTGGKCIDSKLCRLLGDCSASDGNRLCGTLRRCNTRGPLGTDTLNVVNEWKRRGSSGNRCYGLVKPLFVVKSCDR